tara:strand:+ start:390 stop:776 length:387 start_codon:yes stop_codon:yes gene_type:complete
LKSSDNANIPSSTPSQINQLTGEKKDCNAQAQPLMNASGIVNLSFANPTHASHILSIHHTKDSFILVQIQVSFFSSVCLSKTFPIQVDSGVGASITHNLTNGLEAGTSQKYPLSISSSLFFQNIAIIL